MARLKGASKRKKASSEEPEEPPSEEEAPSEEEPSDEDERPKKRRGAAAPRRRGGVKTQQDGGGGAGGAGAGGARRKSGGGAPGGGAAFRDEAPAEKSGDAEQYDAEVEKGAEHPHVKAVSAKELDRLVADVMRVMLFRRHKDGAPVARTDLAALVNKAYKDKRSLAGHVIALAQRRFLSSLGLEMRALDKVRRSEADVKKKVAAAGADKASAAERSYVLRSALPAHLREAYVDREADAALRGLCMVVLSLVAIAGEAGLPEDTLWAQLGALGVAKGAKEHPTFGDADAALEALVKQRYVQRGKAAGQDGGERKVIELAENGLDEIGTQRMSAFIAATMKARSGARDAAGDDDDDE